MMSDSLDHGLIVDGNLDNLIDNNKQGCKKWRLYESETLIKIVSELKILSKLDDKKSKKSALFEDVSKQLEAHAIYRNKKQVEGHWKFLRGKFHTNVILANKSGAGAVKWSLYSAMQELIGDRPIATALEGVESEDNDEIINTQESQSDIIQGSFVDDIEDYAPSPDSRSSTGSECSNGTEGGRKRNILSTQKSPDGIKKSRIAERNEKLMETTLKKQEDLLKENQDRYMAYMDQVRERENQRHDQILQESRDWEKKVMEDSQKFETKMMEWKANQTKEMLQSINETFLMGIQLLTNKNDAK